MSIPVPAVVAACCLALSPITGRPALAQDATTTGSVYPVWGLGFSPDGRWLAAGGGWGAASGRGEPGWTNDGGLLLVWSTDDWSVRHLQPEPAVAASLLFTPDSRRLVFRTGGSDVVLLDVPSFSEIRRWTAHEPRVRGLALTPDGRTIVTGGADGLIRLWELESGALLQTLDPPANPDEPETFEPVEISALAVSPDGRHLFAGTRFGTMRIRDLDSAGLRTTIRPGSFFVSGAGFSDDGGLLFATTYDSKMRIYEADSMTLRAKLDGGGHAGAISPDLRWAACGGSSGEVRIHRLDLEPDSDDVSESIRQGISAFEDDDVTVRESAATEIREIGLPAVPALVASLHAPGAETRLRSRRLLDEVRSPEPEFLLHGHERDVEEVCFSADGALLASGCRGGLVRIWSVPDFTEITTLRVEPRE